MHISVIKSGCLLFVEPLQLSRGKLKTHTNIVEAVIEKKNI